MNAVTEARGGADGSPVNGHLAGDDEPIEDEELIEDDLLVEEISIDGMCGVY